MPVSDAGSDLIEIAELARAAGKPAEALAAASELIEVSRMTDDSALDLAKGLRLKALSLDDLGRSLEARQAWEEARGFFSGLGVAESTLECDARLNR